METKILEIRDKGTFIPAVAVNMVPDDPRNPSPLRDFDEYEGEAYLLRRAGYEGDCILLTRAEGGGGAQYDPYDWCNRTMHVAHLAIAKRWHELKSGDVIDVEYELGETKVAKRSERFDVPIPT